VGGRWDGGGIGVGGCDGLGCIGIALIGDHDYDLIIYIPPSIANYIFQ